ncbi:MAG: BolA family transcriptional regulator [Rickettsiaceae bacterium]|jgi:BolA protein|nr:BolA family transcriptional regulator [Rickettsiaceae bacterium]
MQCVFLTQKKDTQGCNLTQLVIYKYFKEKFTMTISDRIYIKLNQNLSISKLEVVDDSSKHKGHAGWKDGGETHFNIKVISDDFSGKNKVARHKLIYSILDEELKDGIHALSIIALTTDEFKVE